MFRCWSGFTCLTTLFIAYTHAHYDGQFPFDAPKSMRNAYFSFTWWLNPPQILSFFWHLTSTRTKKVIWMESVIIGWTMEFFTFAGPLFYAIKLISYWLRRAAFFTKFISFGYMSLAFIYNRSFMKETDWTYRLPFLVKSIKIECRSNLLAQLFSNLYQRTNEYISKIQKTITSIAFYYTKNPNFVIWFLGRIPSFRKFH